MKFVLFACGVIVLTWWVLPVATADDPPKGDSADADLTAFFKSYLDELFKHRPLDATRLGDHRFDHLLDDLSPAARKANLERDKKTLAALPRQVDYQKLSRAAQIDFEILQHHLRRSIWLAENFRPHETDPRLYVEYATECTYLLLTQSTEPKATNIKNCLARMAAIPQLLQVGRKTLNNPPKVFVETAIKQARGAIAYYESSIFELAEETPQLSDLGKANKPVVQALKDYLQFLEETLLPKASGEWRIGKEKFARKLELELDAGLTADEILKIAEAEAERVRSDMYVLARQLWSQFFPKKPLPPDDPAGRRQTIRLVMAELSREHSKPEELVQDIRKICAELRAFIKEKDILRLPEPDACKIIEMPEFQRGNWVAYLNNAPPLDPKAASYYAISPPPKDWDARRVQSYFEEYNRYMLQILSIHEAYPGHYVQLEYSNRHPSLIRRVLFSGVFAEGWAVYTEQMMLDQGYGRRHEVGMGMPGGGKGQGKELLALRLHQLKFYLRAVVNAILDHKMHCTQMTDDEAMDLLVKGAFQSEGEAVGKIIRAKQSSCQLSTYFVGRTAFYRLRQEISREQGDDFDLGRFHEAVLAHGTLPVKYLPELTRARLKQPR